MTPLLLRNVKAALSCSRSGDVLHIASADGIRWLSVESQVVELSLAVLRADICLLQVLQGEEKSAFPYACVGPAPASLADGSLSAVYLE